MDRLGALVIAYLGAAPIVLGLLLWGVIERRWPRRRGPSGPAAVSERTGHPTDQRTVPDPTGRRRPAPEGWYRDPFGRHEDRWFSMGRPTALVRDEGTEARDDPPSDTFSGTLVESS